MSIEDYLKAVIEPIVTSPFTVSRKDDERGTLLDIVASKDDSGRLIGQKGKTAESLRTLARLFGAKDNKRYSLRINPRG